MIRKFILDLLIEDKVILSLKCIPCDFLQVNYVQLFAELKLWQRNLGLLANFGQPKVKTERIIFHEKPVIVDENYDYIKVKMSNSERSIIKKLQEVSTFVGQQHGLGFGRPIVQN